MAADKGGKERGERESAGAVQQTLKTSCSRKEEEKEAPTPGRIAPARAAETEKKGGRKVAQRSWVRVLRRRLCTSRPGEREGERKRGGRPAATGSGPVDSFEGQREERREADQDCAMEEVAELEPTARGPYCVLPGGKRGGGKKE